MTALDTPEATVLHLPTPDQPPTEAPMEVRRVDRDLVLTYVGGAAAAVSLSWLLYERITPFSGFVGFVVTAWCMFVAFVYVLARQQFGRIAAFDHLVRVLVASAAVLALIPLASIIISVVVRGYHAFSVTFLTKDFSRGAIQSKFRDAGAAHSIVGSLEVVGIAMLISVPMGVLTALFLNEVGGRLARIVRTITDAMSAVPSIVAGLFIFAVLIQSNVLQQTGFAGSLSLAILMLPTVTRTAEVVLRLVPGGLREASLALGATEWRTTSRVVLPTARTGLVTAVVLGVARVIGETAPLIMTMLGAQLFNANPFSGKQDALPLFIWNLKIQGADTRGVNSDWMWSGAFVLLALVLVLFVIARVLGTNRMGQSTR